MNEVVVAINILLLYYAAGPDGRGRSVAAVVSHVPGVLNQKY